MNKWLVGVGLIGVALVMIGYFNPWFIQRAEINGEIISSISFTGNKLIKSTLVLPSLIAIICILGSTIFPAENKFTSIATKIVGIIVIVCGIAILIAMFDKFSDFQAFASLTPFVTTTVSCKYGFILSAFGGILILLAGIFGMVD